MGTSAGKLNLSALTARYAGAPYRLGGCSRSEGYDCLSLLLSVARDMGADLPDDLDGVTIDTYPELWRTDPDRAERLLLRLAGIIGKRIPPRRAFAGDLLFMRPREGGAPVPAFHAGGTLAMSAFLDRGVSYADLHDYVVVRAYRLRKGSDGRHT